MSPAPADPSTAGNRRRAWRFVVALGVVSLFADMTYEGARSIVGPWLGHLGAGALTVGVIGGGAEFLGYSVRWFAGRGADASGRHWTLMVAGYALNMLSVPFLALTSALGPAAGLVVAERLGKGVRTPSRDALIARAGAVVGHGLSFGVHEFLDQLGALTGPLLVAGLVAVAGYRAGFAVLAAPALAALGCLAAARRFESHVPRHERLDPRPFPARFWSWLGFAAFATAGYAHFALVSFHLATAGRLPLSLIPVIFAVAMGAEGLAALAAGRLSGRFGAWPLLAFPLAGAGGTALLFLGGAGASWVGAPLWGAGLGVQSALLRAQVASLVPDGRRGEAFGLLDTAIGLGWLAGSAVLGALYEFAPASLVLAAGALELVALIWLAGLAASASPGSR